MPLLCIGTSYSMLELIQAISQYGLWDCEWMGEMLGTTSPDYVQVMDLSQASDHRKTVHGASINSTV